MTILSIETSCDETGVSIVKASGSAFKPKFRVLGNTLISQIDIHKEYGGVFPTLAKREHARNLLPIFIESLNKAGLLKNGRFNIPETKKRSILKLFEREPELAEAFSNTLSSVKKPKIDAIAVTYGPGLEPALWVGINFAKALALIWEIPLVPVNHMEGHIYSSIISTSDDYKPEKVAYPALALLISGGHTEFVSIKEPLGFKVIGETRDDAVGEAYDKAARMMDLPYPGGPKISKLATEAKEMNLRQKFSLPRPMINTDDLDFSFSGLKTAVLYTIKKSPKLTLRDKRLLAREFQNSVLNVLITKTRKALNKYKPKTLLVGGGVIADKEIRESLENLINEEFKGTKIIIPDRFMSTDNAIMIAAAGYLRFAKEKTEFSPKNISRLKANGSKRL